MNRFKQKKKKKKQKKTRHSLNLNSFLPLNGLRYQNAQFVNW